MPKDGDLPVYVTLPLRTRFVRDFSPCAVKFKRSRAVRKGNVAGGGAPSARGRRCGAFSTAGRGGAAAMAERRSAAAEGLSRLSEWADAHLSLVRVTGRGAGLGAGVGAARSG